MKVVVGTVFVVSDGDSSLDAASAGLKAEPSDVGLKADGASYEAWLGTGSASSRDCWIGAVSFLTGTTSTTELDF